MSRTKPVCSLEISLDKRGFNQLDRILEKILYMVLHKAIGVKSLGFSGFSSLGIRVKNVKLILDNNKPPFLVASIAFQRSRPMMSQHF